METPTPPQRTASVRFSFRSPPNKSPLSPDDVHLLSYAPTSPTTPAGIVMDTPSAPCPLNDAPSLDNILPLAPDPTGLVPTAPIVPTLIPIDALDAAPDAPILSVAPTLDDPAPVPTPSAIAFVLATAAPTPPSDATPARTSFPQLPPSTMDLTKSLSVQDCPPTPPIRSPRNRLSITLSSAEDSLPASKTTLSHSLPPAPTPFTLETHSSVSISNIETAPVAPPFVLPVAPSIPDAPSPPEIDDAWNTESLLGFEEKEKEKEKFNPFEQKLFDD